jgi:hypothetical protein
MSPVTDDMEDRGGTFTRDVQNEARRDGVAPIDVINGEQRIRGEWLSEV